MRPHFLELELLLKMGHFHKYSAAKLFLIPRVLLIFYALFN